MGSMNASFISKYCRETISQATSVNNAQFHLELYQSVIKTQYITNLSFASNKGGNIRNDKFFEIDFELF